MVYMVVVVVTVAERGEAGGDKRYRYCVAGG